MEASFGQKRQRAEGLRYPARPFFVWLVQLSAISAARDPPTLPTPALISEIGRVDRADLRSCQSLPPLIFSQAGPVFRIARRLCSIVLGVLIQDNNYLAQIFRLQPPRKQHFRSIYSEI